MHKHGGTHGGTMWLCDWDSESDVLELANINARCAIDHLEFCLFLTGWPIVHPTKRG